MSSPRHPPPRLFKANRIALVIDQMVVAAQDQTIRDDVRQRICEALAIKNQYTMFLNNRQQPTVAQLVVFGQVLNVPLDVLVELQAGD